LTHPVPDGQHQRSLRSAHRTTGPDPVGVSTFHMHKTRPVRVPPLPRGGGVQAIAQMRRPPPAAFQQPALHPGTTSIYPRLILTRCHQRFTHVHPSGLPLTHGPWMEQQPLRLLPELHTRRYQPRMSRRGQAANTRPRSRHRQHRRSFRPTRPLTACDFVSHHLRDASLFGQKVF
jgi:hypothetical protein